MDGALTALQFAIAAWLLAGGFLGLLGGFNFIRRVESSKGHEPKTWAYWATLIVLCPIILLRAAIWAMWAVAKDGAR